jgi:hypothetical protein
VNLNFLVGAIIGSGVFIALGGEPARGILARVRPTPPRNRP